MCGINGFFRVGISSQKSENQIKLMNTKIKHRGPDDDGFFVDQNKYGTLAFGQLRLSIIDLSERGHQPMGVIKSTGELIYRDDKLREADYILVFNGEIYNFQEIREELKKLGWEFQSGTDTEVLLKSYIQWGKESLHKFNGMFAFVIYDKTKQLLFGARDRFGKKPLKYYWDGENFIFSSELKAILSNDFIKREVDFSAIDDFLTLQYVPAPKTGFKDIYKLPAASYFTLDYVNKKLDIDKYRELDFTKKLQLPESQIISEIEKRLYKSIEYRMIADVPVGAFLSGGVDSSAVVAFASKFKDRLKTFTIKFEDARYDESSYANIVSKQYNTDHNEFLVQSGDMLGLIDELVYHYEEPYADSSNLPTYILSQKTSEFVKVVLNGDGGDENFAGYDKYYYHLKAKILSNIPFLSNISSLFKSNRKLYIYFKTLSSQNWERHINYTNHFDTFLKQDMYNDNMNSLVKTDIINNLRYIMKNQDNLEYLDKILYFDFNTYVPDDLMPKVDIATMAHGLESRTPLLDYTFVEYVAQIPYNMKIRGNHRKMIFKKLLQKYLTNDILFRKKKGFSVPLDSWFRNELKDYISTNLLDKKSFIIKILKQDNVEELLNQHFAGKNNGKKLWTLLVLNKWYEIYFSKS